MGSTMTVRRCPFYLPSSGGSSKGKRQKPQKRKSCINQQIKFEQCYERKRPTAKRKLLRTPGYCCAKNAMKNCRSNILAHVLSLFLARGCDGGADVVVKNVSRRDRKTRYGTRDLASI